MSTSVTWDQPVVSRTTVRGGRCRLAKRRTVSACYTTAYNATTAHFRARTCQNGIDCMLYACGCTLPVDNRAFTLVVCRLPVINSTPPVIDSRSPVVDSRLHFWELPTCMSPLETSNRQPEVCGRRLEVRFRCKQVHGRQLHVVNCEICSLQSPSRGLQSSAETVQSITHLDQSCGPSARVAHRTRPRTCRARAPPGQSGRNLGRDFSRPLKEARSKMAASHYHTRSNNKGAQNGKIPEKRS